LFSHIYYHLLISTLFSIIFVFDGYFSIRSTYFCSVDFFRFTFLCWQNVLGRGFFLRSTVGWICSSQIFFFLLMFSSKIFKDLHRTKNKVTTSNFYCSSTIFSNLIFFYYFSFLWIFLSEIYLFLFYFFVG